MTKPLLIEIGTEELPTRAIDELAAALAAGVCEGLTKRGVAADVANAKIFCSPRRLAVLVPNVADAQPDQVQERRGPALNAAFDTSGRPTKALIGFAQSCGTEVEQLEKLETDKGAWLVHRAQRKGQPTSALVPEILAEAIKALPIAKPMRWGDHEYAFVRPVHWLVILHGDEIVDADAFGVRSGRESRGHRFHHPGAVSIASPSSYIDALRAARVLADREERKARVLEQLDSVMDQIRSEDDEVQHATTIPLSDVVNLTEWPIAIACTFDEAFLAVPREALVETMVANQKFFPVSTTKGLSRHFIGIANIESKDPSEIRKGYERVIRPRFADAKFFWDEDLKTPLAANQSALESVTYQQALGSVWDKCLRVIDLSRTIAERLRRNGADIDPALVVRAASLAKCDLMTRMVGEFPELQGVMGRYYAKANGENDDVANALDEFYAPRFAGDSIARGAVGRVLAVAERLDTLAGIFAVGMKPSGNKDPFALRRAALGLARTLIEADLRLDLRVLFAEALSAVPESAFAAGIKPDKSGKREKATLDIGRLRAQLADELYEFVIDRLRGYYVEQGVATDVFEAVRALAPADLADFDRRVRAVVEFAKLPDAQALAAANKRIGNILRQAGGGIDVAVAPTLLEAGAEAALYTAVETAKSKIEPLVANGDYVATLCALAALRAPVDRFFDDVMVMVDDVATRGNRLALLSGLRRMFLHVADISLLPS